LVAAFGSNDFDSFDLKLDSLPAQFVPFEAINSQPARRSTSAFRWAKPGVPSDLDKAAVWTIALDLLSSANHHCGRLMVHRLYSRRNLQLDVNLLTSEFPTALADALDRTLAHSAQVIALPEQPASLITAQAG
jgi:hypothetical protein